MLEAKGRMNWISVIASRARKDIPILISAESLDFPVSVLWLEEGTYGEPGFFVEGEEYMIKENEITHWMPLPEPPKDGDGKNDL